MLRKFVYAVLGIGALVLMSGCAERTPYAETAVEAGKAVVYVYRPESYANETKVYDVVIDGQIKGKLYDNGYLAVELEPGTTALSVRNSDALMATLESATIDLVDVRSGSAHYVKVDVAVQDAFSAKAVSAQTAKGEIAKTVLYDPDAKKINLYASGAQKREAEPVQPKASSVEQLEKLYELKQKGALSDEEYAKMKAKIIAE